jgi:hypothetical protein
MFRRRFATAAVVGALAVAPAALLATSVQAAPRHAVPAAGKVAPVKAAPPTVAPPKVTPPKVPAPKPPKAAKFTATGTVAAVDAAAGTLAVTGTRGTPALHRKDVVVAVPATTPVLVDGVVATLADVRPGMSVTVHGTATGDSLTATKVQATSPVVEAPADPQPAPEAPATAAVGATSASRTGRPGWRNRRTH